MPTTLSKMTYDFGKKTKTEELFKIIDACAMSLGPLKSEKGAGELCREKKVPVLKMRCKI